MGPLIAFAVAACPIRQRQWIAARHVAACHVAGADAFVYVLGDCTDDTEGELVRALAERHVPYTIRHRPDDPGAGWDRVAPRYDMPNIAAARNAMVETFLEQYPEASHLLAVDSDVMPAPDALARLLAADKPVIGAVVRNGAVLNIMASWRDDEPWRNGSEPHLVEEVTEPAEVAWVGGCVLYQRWVFEELGARYGPDQRAEEIALLRTLRRVGIRPWVHPLARTTHWMTSDRALAS